MELELIGQGREAEVLAYGPGLVLRLLRARNADALAAREHAALTAAAVAGAPVPRPDRVVRHAGRPGLLMERLDGPDLLTLLGARPWLVMSAAHTLGAVHARLHDVVAPRELPSALQRIRDRVSSSDRVPAAMAAAAVEALERLPDGDRLCHNDFHPANVLRTPTGPKVIDWTYAARGDPASDVARTLVGLKLGALPPGAPPLTIALDRVGRGLLVAGYRRAYASRRPLDADHLRRWFAVHAIQRLTESIDAERPALLAVGQAFVDRAST